MNSEEIVCYLKNMCKTEKDVEVINIAINAIEKTSEISRVIHEWQYDRSIESDESFGCILKIMR